MQFVLQCTPKKNYPGSFSQIDQVKFCWFKMGCNSSVCGNKVGDSICDDSKGLKEIDTNHPEYLRSRAISEAIANSTKGTMVSECESMKKQNNNSNIDLRMSNDNNNNANNFEKYEININQSIENKIKVVKNEITAYIPDIFQKIRQISGISETHFAGIFIFFLIVVLFFCLHSMKNKKIRHFAIVYFF